MHRDVKLGLALAVLLIGTTTAFFFRNDGDPDASLPALKNPVEIDGAIVRREVAPYLVQKPTSATVSETVAVDESPWTKPAFLTNSASGDPLRIPAATPDPIQLVEDHDTGLVESPEQPATSIPQSVTVSVGATTHVVQSGDTLSGLAGRYLGSVTRFEEIYELNRDQLSGPHALKIGMTLRLPVAEPTIAKAETNSTEPESPFNEVTPPATVADVPVEEPVPSVDAASPSNESRTVVVEEPTGQKLFIPARKTPFVPSRYRAPKR